MSPPSEYITLAQAAAELPRRRAGRKTSIQTLYRWCSTGCRGVRLRYVQVGATRCTTRLWLSDFIGALTAAAEHTPAPAAPAKPISPTRRRELERVDAELAAHGL